MKFLFNSANHTLTSLSTYPFPLFYEEWGLEKKNVAESWDNKGDIIIGNDVWIGFEAVVLAGVTISDLLCIKWWDWSNEKIARNIAAIQSGCIKELNIV